MTKTKNADGAELSATSTSAKSTTSTDEAPTDISKPTPETSSPSVLIATDEQQIVMRLNNICRECLRHVWEIRDSMQQEMSPRELAEARRNLTGYYSTLTSAHNKADEICTRAWINNRPRYNSDARTSKMVEGTDVGILEKKLRNELKAIEKMISAFKSLIEIGQSEARNQY
jgi:tRNA isopentenyl-2-thiomethyl-A-37 hydroxylase MiaE